MPLPTSLLNLFRVDKRWLAPPLRLAELYKPAVEQVAFPLTLAENQRLLCFNGSAALAQLADQVGFDKGDTILMPAYVCGAELGPFALRGCDFVFYNVQPNLQIDLVDLDDRLQKNAIKAVMVTHYFGFAQREMAKVAELCQSHSVLLIEDCAHALFANDEQQPLGQYGDYAIFSPRKSLPLTEGGILCSNRGSLKPTPERLNAPVVPVLDRLLNAQLNAHRGGNSPILDRMAQIVLVPLSLLIKSLRLVGQRKYAHWRSPEIEGEMARPLYSLKMSGLSYRILWRADAQMCRATRQRNYQCWLACLESMSNCQALIPELDKTACPLFFPVLTADPEQTVQRLEQQGIEAYHWWSKQHTALDLDDYPHLQQLKKSVVALPVHQGLNEIDIALMAEQLQKCLSD